MSKDKILKQKVFHDGTSMVVLQPKDQYAVPDRLRQNWIDEGIIAGKTSKEVARERDLQLRESEGTNVEMTPVPAIADGAFHTLLIGDNGDPVDLQEGNLDEGPSPLNISDEERAHLPQLDHDGDGKPGGSITATGDDLPALRAQYKELSGKNPFNGWDADELNKRIAELRPQDGDGQPGVDQSDAPPA